MPRGKSHLAGKVDSPPEKLIEEFCFGHDLTALSLVEVASSLYSSLSVHFEAGS